MVLERSAWRCFFTGVWGERALALGDGESEGRGERVEEERDWERETDGEEGVELIEELMEEMEGEVEVEVEVEALRSSQHLRRKSMNAFSGRLM